MAEEQRGDRPLAASIGEQLDEKRQLDEQANAERRAVEESEERTERHEAEERADVARHVAAERGPGGWLASWPPLLVVPGAAAAGLLVGLWAGPRRRRRLPLVLPLAAGWWAWRRGLPAG